MNAQHLQRLIQAGDDAPLVIDVRSRPEFEEGHVRSAIHRPFQLMMAGLPDVDRDRPIVVYCGHGPRAYFAAAMLRLHGFRRVSLLEGHWSGWRRHGRPQERGDGRKRQT